MNLYAESSAILTWLLDEKGAQEVLKSLAAAEVIVASDLTIVECDRALIRAVALGELSEIEAADRKAHLGAAASRWLMLRVAPEIVDRARRPFPGDPIRTLDALHLASALTARADVVGLKMLSLDDRIRKVAKNLGLDLLPEDAVA